MKLLIFMCFVAISKSVGISDKLRSSISRLTLLNSTGRVGLGIVSKHYSFIGTVEGKSYYTNPRKLGFQWAEALDYCHELGLHAASIESISQHILVRNYLAKVPHRFFWLAGTDLFSEGNWHWINSGKAFNYTKWTPGYPTKNRKMNCVYLSYGNNGWVDVSCSNATLMIRPLCES